MKLHELIRKHPWTADRTTYPIWEAQRRFFSELRKERGKAREAARKIFGEAYERLRALKPVDTDWSIVLYPMEDEVCCGVSGINPEDPVWETGHPKTYNLAFTPWEKWLGMEIRSDDVAHLSEIDILAHIFMEITYAGMTPQRQNENRQSLIELGEGD